MTVQDIPTSELPDGVLDWDLEADRENIRPGSIELQRIVHQEWLGKIRRSGQKWLNKKPLWRVRCIDKLECLLGAPISGEVLEIGAGTGIGSAFAARRESVRHVTALDYDTFCVEEMMPAVFDIFETPHEKITRALGSYNAIPVTDTYDVVMAFGALHHAEDLPLAFRAAYTSLKPGGMLLVSDVCESDSMSNKALRDRYESFDAKSEERYGKKHRLKDNGDHWYRLSEWITAARSAGFECLPFLFDHDRGGVADDQIFAEARPFNGHQVMLHQPYFADRTFYDPLILIAEKPTESGSVSHIPLSAESRRETEIPKEVEPKQAKPEEKGAKHRLGPQSGESDTGEIERLRAELVKSREQITDLKRKVAAWKKKKGSAT